jgi:hypothetical protein
MSFAISRQIKLRSTEQAIFSKSYNRLNFLIQPDGLATDLSKSYLSMRVYLTKNLSGERVTKEEMAALIANNLCVSFGNNDQSYSPACLIRTARLFAGKGNELLEEVNFCNVLTQSIMLQLCNDFETLEASNLLTGSSSQIGHGSSMPATLTAFLQAPTEVHVFLRDLFGICRHSNFELAVSDGLQIQLELEDRQNLFKITSLGDFQTVTKDISGNVAVLPEKFTVGETDPLTGFLQSTDSMAVTSIAPGQFDSPSAGMYRDVSGNCMIQVPKEGLWYSAEVYFEQPTKGALINQLTFKGALPYTAPQLSALGFVTDNFVKLRYAIKSSYVGAATVEPKLFSLISKMGTVQPGANPSVGLVQTLWYDDIPGRTIDDNVEFLGCEVLRSHEVVSHFVDGPASGIAAKLASNQFLFLEAELTQLKSLGVLDLELKPTGVTFDIGISMVSGEPATDTSGCHIMPDVITNELSPSIRKIYSNQTTKLPTQGAKARVLEVGAVDASGNALLTFSSLGCEAGTSIQSATIYPTGDETKGIASATSAALQIWNVQNLLKGPSNVSESPIPAFWNNLSYQIDRFECVLVQNTVDPKNRMPSPFVYSTWKLETATIETAQQTWARQFILEQGVYNCFLLTPVFNTVGDDKGSLISTARGVSHYRYSVNQINQTNRDVYFKNFRSDYPSSLYIDRLTDTFSNSEYILRSPVGIKGVQETADPVLMYPLRIYNAVSESAYMMGGPGGATVQINMFADTAMNRKIVPGNVFFYKQLLKQM